MSVVPGFAADEICVLGALGEKHAVHSDEHVDARNLLSEARLV